METYEINIAVTYTSNRWKGAVRVITAAKRLPASEAVAAKLVPAIQCAIANAQPS